MSMFERNAKSMRENSIRQGVEQPRIGKVDEVYEHGAPDDDSNFEANIILEGRENPVRDCPILNPGNNAIDIPEAGDKVMLLYSEDEKSKPYVIDTAWTTKDRPPVGKAGMWKREFNIDGSTADSMAGSGDIYLTGYTEYDKEASVEPKGARKPEKALVQLAKHPSGGNKIPTDQENLPVKVEMYDAPVDGDAHVTVEMNKVGGKDSDATWGIKFDISTGEWQLVGPKGFGISSDGAGNFTWHHKSIDLKEHTSDTGPLSL